jgi:outer membrane protein assembly factor BamB
MKLATIFMLVGCLFSCQKEKDILYGPQGEVTSQPPLWHVAVDAGNGKYLAYGVSSAIVYDNRYVLCPGVEPFAPKGPYGRAVLNMVDTQDEVKMWTWNDYFNETADNSDIVFPLVVDKYLVISEGPRTRCIDLRTGKTLWMKKKRDGMTSLRPIAGTDKHYFFPSTTFNATLNQFEGAIYRGSVLRPEEEELIVYPEIKRQVEGTDFQINHGASSLQVFTRQLDTLLVVDYQTSIEPARQNLVRSEFGVFNVSQRRWEYKDVLLLEGYGAVVDGMPLIHQDRVYHSTDRAITCHDLATGKELWRQKFPGNFLFSGFVITDNVLVANCEDTYIYGLNPQTGQQLWKEKSNGTSSRMFPLNGVVYYAGGAVLHAVEVATGRHLWRLQSPDLKRSSGAYFFGFVSGIPPSAGQKGKILACTGLNVYAYEAAR